MPTLSTLLTFAVAAAVLVAIPGPNMLFILGQGISHGRRAAFASAVGVELGTLFHVLATVVGLSAVIAASAIAFNTLRYLGIAYLLFLAWRSWPRRGDFGGALREVPHKPVSRLLRDGALTNILNPKVALFFLALLPQFTDQSAGSVPLQMLVLGLTSFVIALAMDLVYAASSVAIGEWMKRFHRSAYWQGIASSVSLLGIAVWAAMSGNGRAVAVR